MSQKMSAHRATQCANRSCMRIELAFDNSSAAKDCYGNTAPCLVDGMISTIRCQILVGTLPSPLLACELSEVSTVVGSYFCTFLGFTLI